MNYVRLGQTNITFMIGRRIISSNLLSPPPSLLETRERGGESLKKNNIFSGLLKMLLYLQPSSFYLAKRKGVLYILYENPENKKNFSHFFYWVAVPPCPLPPFYTPGRRLTKPRSAVGWVSTSGRELRAAEAS